MTYSEPDMLGAFSPERAPILMGYTYDPEEAFLARDRGTLLSISIDMGGPFHMHTEPSSGGVSRSTLSYREIAGIIGQARDLGLQSAVFENITAPDLHPQLRGIISQVHSLNILPVLRISATAITGEFAGFLRDRNASVIVRLQPPDHPKRVNTERLLRRKLRPLIDAGFTSAENRRGHRLGVDWMDERFTPEGIESFWDFCRCRNIFPILQAHSVSCPPDENNRKLLLRLREIDRDRYGYQWSEDIVSERPECIRLLYSLSVTGEGNVRPCEAIALDKNPAFFREGVYPHNIRIRSLGEIYGDPLFRYIRMGADLSGEIPETGAHFDAHTGCRGSSYVGAIRNGEAGSRRSAPNTDTVPGKGEPHGQD